ncbi:MAG: GNAT family N-acetyltransferase [Solirubrobacterales bacterium]|nr:GNAT family N-acetyltransferase [Solirubrobacterales bacterium]MBV9716387.1 GNAT family N-acetyltransferase [Solirubrobacterales bacterium]
MTSPQPAGTAPPLVRDVLLLDGSTLRLRAPGPEDLDDVVAFYTALSPESRYMRFHGYGRTDTAARALVQAGGVDRAALIGRHGDRVVAVAQYELLREPGAAEVAFAVADDFQRRGAATRMLEQLAAIGAERGLRRFDAEVLSENRPMLSVFEHAGYEVRRAGAFGEVTVSLDVRSTEAVRERIDERDHAAAVASIRPIVAPTSIAVVGASGEPGDVGGAVLAGILAGGFRGVAMVVNRSEEVVHSMRAAPSLQNLPERPELVIIAVPGDEVIDAATDAAVAGARAVLVLTTDFSESAAEAAARHQQLLEAVRARGLRLVGPSSLGVINTDPAVSLVATFAGAGVAPGRLAICSQSGAIGIGLLGHAAARRLGVAAYLSLGERVDVSTNDVLELWEDDDRVAAVMLYVETFGNPQHFARIAQRVSRRKPILAVKGRRAAEARHREAQSHTAAALRGDAVADALFRQAGILRFRSGDELFSAAEFFESQPLPRGRHVAIVSNSEGVATIAADACATRGLVVAAGERPGAAEPVVLGAGCGGEDYGARVRALLADRGVDAVMAYYVDRRDGDPERTLAAVSDAARNSDKPVVASIIGADGRLPAGPADGVPNYRFPEACAGVLGRAVERREWLSRPLGQRPRIDGREAEAREVIARCLEQAPSGGCWLEPEAQHTLLAGYGIETEPASVCATLAEAVAAATAANGPVALRANLPVPEAAADIDAVLLGLEGEEAVQGGWRELERRVGLSGRPWRGATVQRLVGPGADLLVGAVSDPDLGPVMAVGLGGRQAGLAGTAAFRLLPGTDVEADELIDASDGAVAQLGGFRGRPKLDREALRELLLRFAALLRDHPEVTEVDLNPVRVLNRGYVVLETRLRAARHRAPERVKTW